MQYKKKCISFKCTVQQCIRKWCSTDAHFSLIPASPPTLAYMAKSCRSTFHRSINYFVHRPVHPSAEHHWRCNIKTNRWTSNIKTSPRLKEKKIPIFWPHLWYYTKLSCSAQLYNFIGTFKTLDQGKRWFKK